MGAYPPFELTKSISRRKAGAQPGGLETSGGVGTTPSIPCRLASLVLLNLKMAGGLKVGSPTIGGQKLQTYTSSVVFALALSARVAISSLVILSVRVGMSSGRVSGYLFSK